MVRLALQGPSGATLQLRHEELGSDASLDEGSFTAIAINICTNTTLRACACMSRGNSFIGTPHACSHPVVQHSRYGRVLGSPAGSLLKEAADSPVYTT